MPNKSSYYETLAKKLENTLPGKGYEKLDDVQYMFWCPHTQTSPKHENKTKRKLSVNFELNVFRCWSCNYSGKVDNLLYTHNVLNKIDINAYRDNFVKERKQHEVSYTTKIDLPKYKMFAKDNLIVAPFNYMKERLSCTMNFLKEFEIGYTLSTGDRTANCIVVPSYNKQYKPNYFFARSYQKGSSWKANPKNSKKDIVFFESKIDWNNKDIVLVEGVFDALKLWTHDIQAIPLLGKDLGEDYLLLRYIKLYNMKPKVFFDRDALESAIEMSSFLQQRKIKADVIYPYKETLANDPCELKHKEIELIKEKYL